MSFLRVCASAKYLRRRALLEKCAARLSLADCCRPRVTTGSGAVRRLSETPLRLQRLNVSPVIPKTEDARKRVLEQSQLLDVLDARIQQLQTDVVLDVQHAKVQFVKAPSARKVISLAKSMPKKKTDIPLSERASKSQPKLTKEGKSKQQQKLLKNVVENSVAKSKAGTSSSQTPPGASHKIVSSTAKTTISVIKARPVKLSEQIGTAITSSVTPTAAAFKVSKWKQKGSRNQPLNEEGPDAAASKAQGKDTKTEETEGRLSQQANKWTALRNPELLQANSENNDTLLNICSYLEACVFVGEVENAHRFLLSQHRAVGRRKHLNTNVYNIIMRVWAKQGTLNKIGHLFILLEEAGLKPNVGSYCAALECMGRKPVSSPKVISRCLDQLKEDGLSLDELFTHAFQQDEREMVLNAIHVIEPNYQPCLNQTTNECSSPLVQDFYAKREEHNFSKLDFTQEELNERFKQQLSVEQACSVTIDSVEVTKPVTVKMAKRRELLAELRAQWKTILLQAFRESKMTLAKGNTKHCRPNLHPYLCVLADAEYVDIMIQSVANLPPSGELLKTLAGNLGNRVYTKYCVQKKHLNHTVKKLGSIYNTYTELLAKDTKNYNILPREQWNKLETQQSSGLMMHGQETTWSYTLTLELGIYLMDMMIKNLKLNSNILYPAHDRKPIPILYHMYAFRSTQQVGFIKPHPILTQIQQEAMETKLTFDSFVMPMLCPPVPWTSVKFGAYLLTPAKLMRTVDGAIQHNVLLEKCQNLHAVLDSLNQLGNCAWKINKPLLDIIISIFNDRGSDKLDVPPPMSEAPPIPHFKSSDPNLTASEKAQMKRQVLNAKKKCSEMHSLRMDALYKLSIANHVRDEIFWFPHNMDFRGRTYPCPPYFNHLGSDITRAILIFAEGKPLGPKGLDWLKIHLINLTGLKKRSSLQGRLEYANTIMEDILDSADNPLNGKKWWMNADEPWQALGCCMEIADAVRSPDPAKFSSHFPVHQDGSCNGLQHYAALGRDVIGAASVNLKPCNVPQDVYSGVAQQVEEFRSQDAASGLKIAQVLEGFISRKVVKQTVMTVVYGVTRYGGRLQIEKRLKEIDEFPKEYVWDASHYLVKQVFSSLKEMFTGTREIQDWLTESARLISKSGHAVQWVTPLGLPIVQPYHRTRRQVLKGTIQDINLKINYDINARPDTVKQKNAFPPNFIHSLDSTHMMLTALFCSGAGLTFVSVHDCFWTHAITVDTMNKVCREQFVALHSQPILQELSNLLLRKYCTGNMTEAKNKTYQEQRRLHLLLSQVPQTGDFDLNQVKESTYFFS